MCHFIKPCQSTSTLGYSAKHPLLSEAWRIEMQVAYEVAYEVAKTFCWRLPISLLIAATAIALMAPAMMRLEVRFDDWAEWLA